VGLNRLHGTADNREFCRSLYVGADAPADYSMAGALGGEEPLMRRSEENKLRENYAEVHRQLAVAKNELHGNHFELKEATEKLNKMCQLCDRQRFEITRLRSLLMAVKVLVRAMGE
jgi:hypothetical protein